MHAGTMTMMQRGAYGFPAAMQQMAPGRVVRKSSLLGNLGAGAGGAMMRRRWYSCWRAWLVTIGLLVGLQILTACLGPLGSSMGATSTETLINRVERGMLDATDLPFGWRHESTGVPQDLTGGIVARYRDYRGPANTPIFVKAGQSTALYASEAESDAAYRATARKVIPVGHEGQWPRPPELDFTTQADAITVGCSAAGVFDGIPAHTCRVAARYGNLVMTISGQIFEGRWLTVSQFRYLLERVDAKMAAIREPQGSDAPTPTP